MKNDAEKDIKDRINSRIKIGQNENIQDFIDELSYMCKGISNGGYWGYPYLFVKEIANKLILKENEDKNKWEI